MKLGLGLYRHQLNDDHFHFARQCGCTHLVVHLVDYFRSSRSNHPGDQPVGDDTGWGLAGDPNTLWSEDELIGLRQTINAAGLELAAIENFDPAHWHDVILDGPQKSQQLENLKTIIRRVGRAGIPIIGYEAVDTYSRAERLAYVHLRNVRGKVPFYQETFIDDGDVDVWRVLQILKRNKFSGVIIPDHAPQMTCDAPWHAGMAYALGYLRSASQRLEQEG